MALAIEFANVIARKGPVAAVWPGGLDALAADHPSFIEDATLVRVGFMDTREADALVEQLGVGIDAVAVVQRHVTPPEWLIVCEISGEVAVWLSGEPPGPLVVIYTGFAAEGPVDLAGRLRRWCDSQGIVTEPAPQPVVGGDESWRFIDGPAVIDVDVFVDTPPTRCRLWAARDSSRRALVVADVALCERLLGALPGLGARKL